MEKIRLLNIGILFSALSFAGATLVSEAVGKTEDDGDNGQTSTVESGATESSSMVTREAAVEAEIKKNLGAEKPVWRFFIPAKQITELKSSHEKMSDAAVLEDFDRKNNIPALTETFTTARSAIFKSSTAATDESDYTNLLSYMGVVTNDDDDDADDAYNAFRVAYRDAEGGTPAAYFDISAAGSGINTDTTMADLAGMIQALINEQGGTLTDFIAQKTAVVTAAATLTTKTAELGNAFDALHYPTDDSLTTGADLTARRNDYTNDYTAYTDKKTPYQTAYTGVLVASTAFDEIAAEAHSGEIKTALTGLDPDSTVPAGALYPGRNYGGLTKSQLVSFLVNQQRHYEYAELQQAAKDALTAYSTAVAAGTTYDQPASGDAPPRFVSFENFQDYHTGQLAEYFGYVLNNSSDFDGYSKARTHTGSSALSSGINNYARELIRLAEATISTSTTPTDTTPSTPRDSTVQQVYDEIDTGQMDFHNEYRAASSLTTQRAALSKAFALLERAGVLDSAADAETDIDNAMDRIDRDVNIINKELEKASYLNALRDQRAQDFTHLQSLLQRFVSLIDRSGTVIGPADNTKDQTMEWLADALVSLRDSSAFAGLGSTVNEYNQFIEDNPTQASGSKIDDLTDLKTELTSADAIKTLVTAINGANLPTTATLSSLLDLVAKYDEYVGTLEAFKARYTGVADDGTPITEPNNADLITAITTLQTALGDYDTAVTTKGTADTDLVPFKTAVETALRALSGSTDLDADEVATAKLKENLEAIHVLLGKMESDDPDLDQDPATILTLTRLSELMAAAKEAKTALDQVENQRRGLMTGSRGEGTAVTSGDYRNLLTELTQNVIKTQNRLTEFALLDTLWQHSALTGANSLSLEIDGSGSWLTHWLDGAIGDVALTGSYRSGNFHVNLTASYAISHFKFGLENIKWVSNDLITGILKLGYHSGIGFRGNAYLSGGSTILSKTGKWMYGIGGHMAYTVWLQPAGFSISLTPSLQVDSAFTRNKKANEPLSYSRGELGFDIGFHIVIDPTVWKLSVAIPIKGSVTGNYDFDTKKAGLPPILGLTAGLDFSVNYSDYATVTLGYGFSTSSGIFESKVSLIYLKHTGRLGLRLDI